MAITRQELKQLANATLKPGANFSATDANKAFSNALAEYIGLEENYSMRDINRNKALAFELIEEVLDENLPAQVTDMVGMFAEVKTYARDAQPMFTIKNLGEKRVAYGIQAGARNGVYKARRLDSRSFLVKHQTETVSYSVTLEELLLGTSNLSEIIAAVARGFVDRILVNVVSCLRASYANLPAANKASGNALTAGLDPIIRVVSAYGRPVIMAFRTEAEKILHSIGADYVPNVPVQDIDEIRSKGFVSIYKGTPIVIIPNYLMDENNTQWLFKENDVFVIPADEKPVKVALRGETHVEEAKHAAGGSEWNVHRMVGVGMFFYNSIGMYRDTAGDESGIY